MSNSCSYSDDLWSCVMNDVINRNPNSKNNWRHVTNRDADCSLCSDTGGGALIQCSKSQCNHEYHIPCAFNTQGSFILDNDGNLQYECEAHYEPVTFCICKQEYDEYESMISCDGCNEWYHNKCVGLTKDIPDTYICQSCKNLKNAGKKISDEKIQSNRDKENRSADVQAAEKAMRYLIYLNEEVVPVMKNMNIPTLTKYKDINETLKILSTQFAVAENTSILGSSVEDDVERFGTGSIIKEWIEELKKCQEKIEIWKNKSTDAVIKMMNELGEPSLNFNQISLLENHLNDLTVWQKEIDEMPLIESSSSFVTILECLKWLIELLTIIHTDDSYCYRIINYTKLAHTKTRKLEQFNIEYCGLFANYFNNYVKMANEMANLVSNWSTTAQKRISGEILTTLTDLENILEDAKANFPRMPLLVDDLKEVLESARSIDGDINNIINDKNGGDLNNCLRLKDASSSVTVVIPSMKKLNLVISYLYFLHDFETQVNSKDRALEENVTELLERSNFPCDDTNKSVLSSSLSGNVNAFRETLQNFQSEVSSIKKDASKILSKSAKFSASLENNMVSIISNARNFKVITNEERALDYIINGKKLLGQAEKYIKSKDQHDIREVESCYKELSDMSNDHVADKYVFSKAFKDELAVKKDELLSLLKIANDQWKRVKDLIACCESGQTTYEEDFKCYFDEAIAKSNFIDKAVIDTNNYFKEEILKLTPSFEVELNKIVDPVNDLNDAKLLVEKLHRLPFPKAMSNDIIRRYNTCKLVTSCREFINSNATDTDELNRYQAYRQQLLELLSSPLKDIEKSMIESVKEEFLFKLFKAEYSFTRNNKISFEEVKAFLSTASALGEKATNSPEYKQFSSEIDEFDKLRKSIDELLQRMNSYIENGNGKYKEKDLFSTWQTNLSEIQTKLLDLMPSLKTKNFTDANLEGQIALSIGVLDSVLQSLSMCKELDRSDREFSIYTIPKFQLTQLTNVVSKIKQLLDLKPNSGLERLLSLLNDYHSQALKLNDYALGLVPQRAKRKKQKADLLTLSELEDVFKKPIAQVFILPMRESLLSTIQSVNDLRNQIKEFLVGSPFRNCNDHMLSENIKDNISHANELKQAIEFQSIDIDYGIILSWISDILLWMQSINSAYGDNIEDRQAGALTFEFASAKIKAGSNLLQDISISDGGDNFLRILSDLQIIKNSKEFNFDDIAINSGLCIKSAQSLYYQLQEDMSNTLAFEAEFDDCQSKELSKKVIRDLHSRMLTLAIKPNDDVFKTVENALSRYNKGVTSSGKVIESDKIRTIYDDDDDEYDDDQDDFEEDIKISTSQSSNKKQKIDNDSKKVIAPVKKEKQLHRKASSKCCNPNCKSGIMLNSSYCSDTCAINTSSSIVSGLLTMRNVLYQSNVHDNPALRKLKTAFSKENDMKAAIDDINNGIINYQKLLINDKKALDKAEKKNSGISSILQCLPNAASFLVKTDHEHNEDKDRFRIEVRYRLEDILITSLVRQAYFGAISIGAVLAVDLEEGLHKKHLGKKDALKTHYVMLMRNLKQPHNDRLILRLVNSTLTIEALLNMTDKEFAKEDLKQERAQQRSEAASKLYVQESVANHLENLVSTSMAGNETWRSKEIVFDNTIKEEKMEVPMETDEVDANEFNEDMNCPSADSNDGAIENIDKSPEKLNAVPKKVAKRPLDVDAAARYVVSAKIPRLDSEDSSPTAAESKAKDSQKALQFLKQTSVTTPMVPLKTKEADSLPTTLRLLSSVGTDKFTVTGSRGVPFTCYGYVTNKSLQGLLEKSFTIDGRVKIEELNKFIQQTVEKGKKVIDCTRMYALSQDAGFESFTAEFSNGSRVGICHISKTADNKPDGKISFYVIPSTLRDSVPFLNRLGTDIDKRDDESLLFYGLIISVEPGPDLYVNASPRMYDIFTSSKNDSKSSVVVAPATSTPKLVSTSSSSSSSTNAAVPTTTKIPSSSSSSAAPPPPPSSLSLTKTTSISSSSSSSSSSLPSMKKNIKQVVEFISKQPNGGSAMIAKLRSDERSREKFPFLFEDSPFYNDFLAELKDELSKKK